MCCSPLCLGHQGSLQFGWPRTWVPGAVLASEVCSRRPKHAGCSLAQLPGLRGRTPEPGGSLSPSQLAAEKRTICAKAPHSQLPRKHLQSRSGACQSPPGRKSPWDVLSLASCCSRSRRDQKRACQLQVAPDVPRSLNQAPLSSRPRLPQGEQQKRGLLVYQRALLFEEPADLTIGPWVPEMQPALPGDAHARPRIAEAMLGLLFSWDQMGLPETQDMVPSSRQGAACHPGPTWPPLHSRSGRGAGRGGSSLACTESEAAKKSASTALSADSVSQQEPDAGSCRSELTCPRNCSAGTSRFSARYPQPGQEKSPKHPILVLKLHPSKAASILPPQSPSIKGTRGFHKASALPSAMGDLHQLAGMPARRRMLLAGWMQKAWPCMHTARAPVPCTQNGRTSRGPAPRTGGFKSCTTVRESLYFSG